jgi:hypothetical protein
LPRQGLLALRGTGGRALTEVTGGVNGGSARPPGGPRPPAPPATGEPQGGPNPADPGPPIAVQLDDLLLGDLGNRRVDARLLSAVLVRGGPVAQWLQGRGIDLEELEATFPGSGWE